MKLIKKIVKKTAYLLFLFMSIILLFEVSYRYNVIDFYKTELNSLNPKEDLILTKPNTILIFGDSFSADPNSYIKTLRDSLPNFNIINSAIPGTSVFQTKTFFKRRVKTYKPDHIIIQLYVGNDLIDYAHPTNWSNLSLSRYLYWTLSDNLISLQYLNYKTGQFKSSKTKNLDPKTDKTFNKETYNHREKLYYKAEPMGLYNTVNLLERKKDDFKQLINDLNEILDQTNIKTSILVIPHVAQVSKKNEAKMKLIGAKFPKSITNKESYPFINLLKEKINSKASIISPLSYFLKNNKSKLYYQNDPHLNLKGQRFLGEFVLTQLDL